VRDLAVLFLHLLVTVARLAGPGEFQRYYNGHRTHAGLDGRTPESSTDMGGVRASVSSYRWQPHGRGLYQTPMAA
jgi:hypothetical protein